ncbi:MAG TPA: amidohydrolase [Bacteroidales bacterium]|jgi:predicted amidohydrolase|nr:amidohydrolase [Bacteroidales bacterium]
MKTALVQFDIAWENKSVNFRKVESLISECRKNIDLIILPEMFNTGFSMNPAELSEKPGSETFVWMRRMACESNAAICGSYIVEDGGTYHNRWTFVSPENEVYFYDKRHLFSPGGEDRLFTKGRERVVFTYKGFRICPNICYDLRFPVWSRNRNDYDLLINSANWPTRRQDVWNILLKARAIENQCYVAGVNRTGIDGSGIKYTGESVILGPGGETIASDTSGNEGIIYGEISQSELSDFRRKFPVLNDGDDFTINS